MDQDPANAVFRQALSHERHLGGGGTQRGRFDEPGGVAICRATQQLVVADTNNRRLQVFRLSDGAFLYTIETPRRFPKAVCVLHCGSVAAVFRKPLPGISLYNPYGRSVSREILGELHIQNPRGVCCDELDNLIVVESLIMRLHIFVKTDSRQSNNDYRPKPVSISLAGKVEFPMGVAASRGHLYVVDNRADTVKVFKYDGEPLFNIGGPGLTNRPIAVSVDDRGRVFVGDNHGALNITVFGFRRDRGWMVEQAFRSPARHQKLLAMTFSRGRVIATSTDNTVHVYKL